VIAGPWADWDEYRAWWPKNVTALNRLSTEDPAEWERVTRKLEHFFATVPWTPPKETT